MRPSTPSDAFGVVKVDGEGNIEVYNKYEQDLGSLTEAEVHRPGRLRRDRRLPPPTRCSAACSRTGVAANNLNHLFPYTFTYKMSPTPVKVRAGRDQATSTNWILVKKA